MKRGFSGTVNIGDELRQLAGAMERKNPDLAASARVQIAWRKAVDARVAQHTNAVFVVPHTDGGEVVVYMDSPLWAADMNMQAERFRMHLNIALGELYEDEGEGLGDGALFDIASRVERVKKLKFAASKDAYAGRAACAGGIDDFGADEQPFQVDLEPLSADADAELQASAGKLDDDELRAAALAAARANLGRRKALEHMTKEHVTKGHS